jgi:hypothetical protein
LPSGLTSIGSGAFANNKIQSVVIPDSLSSISSIIRDKRHYEGRPTSYYRGEGDDPRNIKVVFEGNPIARITLPADKSDSDLKNLGLDSNLITFYAGQGRLAGTYEQKGKIWARSRAGGID